MGQALFSSGQSMLVHAVGNMNKTKCLLALLSQCLHLTASKETTRAITGLINLFITFKAKNMGTWYRKRYFRK